MDVSLKWLNKLVDISEYSIEEIVSKVTIAGIEIEDVKYLARGSNLVIGKVLECVSHPDSDHLHVCKVDEGKSIEQIVCGAPNVAVGQKVIVALPGAYLPAKDIAIQKGVIRGVESNGMLCSLLELGVDGKYLSEESKNGIEVLSNDAVVGDSNPLGFLGLDDVILELKPTPDRGDVLSILSFAYEVAAVFNKKVNFVPESFNFKLEKSNFNVLSETDKCTYFNIKGIRDIKIKESPKWLVSALQGCSIRSINNVVDIGNYVMLLTGQPLHMYDADKIKSKSFIVRDNYQGEFVALDNQTYNLELNDLVVTNDNEVSCLAGVMGGKNTEVDENTKNIAIEAAIFNGTNVRKTSGRLQLISDSSTRFVRGIDSTRALYALDLAAKLLIELADAKVVEETVSYGNPDYEAKEIELTKERVNGLLGTNFSIEEIKEVFVKLNFEVKENSNTLLVVAPSYRRDIFDTEDLVEEVIRMKGFDCLGNTYPVTTNIGGLGERVTKTNIVRNHLLGLGIDEATTYSLTSEKYINDFNVFSLKDQIRIMHPLTDDKEILKFSLIPTLLQASNYNYYHNINNVKLFEVGNVYSKDGEFKHLGIVLSGEEKVLEWKKEETKFNFFHIKGIVVSLLAKFGIEDNRYQLVRVEENNKYYHLGCACYIKTGNKIWGVMGLIHPNMQKKYDVNNTVVAELDLDYLFSLKTSAIKFVEPSIYPSITRDIALVLNKEISSADVIKVIKKNAKGLVTDCFVFDEYIGEHVGEGKKSLALRIVYHSDKQTLKDQDILPIHNEILDCLEKEYKAVLRS